MSSPKIITKGECEILYENGAGDWQKGMDSVNRCTVEIIASSLGHWVVNKESKWYGRNVVKGLASKV